MKIMKRLKNLKIKLMINIQKTIKIIKKFNYTGFWSKIRSSELRLDYRNY